MNAIRGARAFLGMSHTPLLGLATLDEPVERELLGAIANVREHVLQWAPDRIVLIGPDHYNGFFNELMPAFCIGSEAASVGDYLMPAGPLNVDAAIALAIADFLMDEGFDPAVSRRMRVDHGFVQPLQFVWGGLDTPPVIPLFINAVAPPTIPRVRRCRRLGLALGRFIDRLPGRTLLLASGGLSHEPPVPTLAHPDPQVRERITIRAEQSDEMRRAKTARVLAAGLALAAGDAGMKPLNAAWDRRWMDAIEHGRLAELEALSEHSISEEAGLSAHESKTWLVGRAALGEGIRGARFRHYQAIDELIAGYGLMFIDGADPQ
ncbi:3-carboxyethylcatechol 2,3-dioxygenase [Variovorax sp. J22P168]|uniref:3-carboxyethylcatechol 2,3-dioxygenase n=1 Tax=Variovorax jilinensis TaxID=3053513 RepID=UPI002575FB01|nr:3-carboxyethylcatechol 2,3-dioxygenase [Variovorax sp. J22P168]MDM0014880.1 3-carboxyethylcatechol 2,3-dioxygenase [Variovorax sp. J22P168]